MYKGMVLKVTTEYAVVITDDNSYCKIIFKEGLIPGQRIYFFEEDKLGSTYEHEHRAWFNNLNKKAIALTVMVACVVFFFLFSGIGLEYKDRSYYAVVSVDINPSVELRLDEGSYVIGVDTLNQEGKEVAGNYLLGLKANKAISLIIKNAEELNFLNSENDTILLATALKTLEVERMQELMVELSNVQYPSKYSYFIIPMEKDEVAKAKEKELSLGKYAMLDLAEGSFLAEEVRNMKVEELVASKTIKAKLQEKEEQKQIKINGKKSKDIPSKGIPHKIPPQRNEQGKPNTPGRSGEINSGKENPSQGKENPSQGKNMNKGKPDSKQLQ